MINAADIIRVGGAGAAAKEPIKVKNATVPVSSIELSEEDIKKLYTRTTILKPYASGSFGKVYKIKDKAVKVISLNSLDDKFKNNVELIEKEVGVFRNFNNSTPSIFPKFYGMIHISDESLSIFVIVMEWINGMELTDFISLQKINTDTPAKLSSPVAQKKYETNEDLYKRIKKGITLEKALTQTKGAIEYLHASGYVHRDIKPENIMVAEKDGEYRIYLIDPGFTVSIGEKIKNDGSWGYNPYLLDIIDSKDPFGGRNSYISRFPAAKNFRDKDTHSDRATPALNAFAFNTIVDGLDKEYAPLKFNIDEYLKKYEPQVAAAVGGARRSKKRRKAKLTRRRRRRTHRR